jgi:hypothetical protein
MNIEQLKQAMQIAAVLGEGGCVTDFPMKVGDQIFMRTVTLYYTGRIKAVCGNFLTLSEAAWIPDTGRFHDALKGGKFNEVEPFIDDVHIPLTSIIDVTRWGHKLPQEQK